MCLVDVGMPEMQGYELATSIRRTLGTRSVTLIAITGYGQPQNCERALQAGFNAHFAKPVDADGLMALLAERARQT